MNTRIDLADLDQEFVNLWKSKLGVHIDTRISNNDLSYGETKTATDHIWTMNNSTMWSAAPQHWDNITSFNRLSISKVEKWMQELRRRFDSFRPYLAESSSGLRLLVTCKWISKTSMWACTLPRWRYQEATPNVSTHSMDNLKNVPPRIKLRTESGVTKRTYGGRQRFVRYYIEP